jgi:ribosomal protein S18 acetylase RimI-like enzyme
MILPSPYNIKQAQMEDVESIASLHNEYWKTAYKEIIDSNFLDQLDYTKRLDFRKDLLKQNLGVHLVATYDDKIIGFCDASVAEIFNNQFLNRDAEPKERLELGQIYGLYVAKAHQAKGIEGLLFQKTKELLKKKKLVPFIVWVVKTNTRESDFYTRCGGKEVEQRWTRIGNHDYIEIAYQFGQ